MQLEFEASHIELIEKTTRTFNFVFLANIPAATTWNDIIVDDEDLLVLKWDRGTWQLVFLHDDDEIKSPVTDPLTTLKKMYAQLRSSLKPIATYDTIANITAKDLKQIKRVKAIFMKTK